MSSEIKLIRQTSLQLSVIGLKFLKLKPKSLSYDWLTFTANLNIILKSYGPLKVKGPDRRVECPKTYLIFRIKTFIFLNFIASLPNSIPCSLSFLQPSEASSFWTLLYPLKFMVTFLFDSMYIIVHRIIYMYVLMKIWIQYVEPIYFCLFLGIWFRTDQTTIRKGHP